MGPHILGPAFSALAVLAAGMAWIAALAALATACAVYLLVFSCSLAIFASLFDWFLCSAFESSFLRLSFLSS